MTRYRDGYESEGLRPGEAGDQLSLLDPDLRGLVHTDDPDTSHEAAEEILPRLNQIQGRVLDLLREHGPMTDCELHARYVQAYGPVAYSTARTRRGELRNQGLVIDTGTRRPVPDSGLPAVVWAITA